MLDMFIDTPYSNERFPEMDFDKEGTYEEYLKWCEATNGDPYSKEEWEKMTGIKA